jgi:endo-1,4-beta-mannosidase
LAIPQQACDYPLDAVAGGRLDEDSVTRFACCVLTSIWLTVASPAVAFENFIHRDGHRLMDGDRDFRFIGLHATELHRIEDDIRGTCPGDRRGWGQYFKWPTAEEQENWIRSLTRSGHTASRVYTLSVQQQDDAACAREVHVLAPASPGGNVRLNEQAMRVYDRMIALADENGLRLILPFIDHWEWWGGRKQLAAFYGETEDDFYDTDSRTYAAYLDLIRQVITRRNTITGRFYYQEKAIMAWETGNELKLSTSEFVRRTAAHIKSLAPQQLVVDGNYLNLLRSSLDDANVDIINNHLYPANGVLSPATIQHDLAFIGGRKAYIVGEFGLAPVGKICDVLQSVVDTEVGGARAAGALLWGLRGRRHEGGFYWHREGSSDYYSYHLPGFASNDDFEERAVIDAVRLAQAQLRGEKRMAPLPIPEAPRLRAVGPDRVLRWMGAPVARSYRIERAARGSDAWTTIASGVSDGTNRFDPRRDTLFRDADAGDYDYRVIAVNESGESPPSNVRSAAEFVSVAGTEFRLQGQPYRFVGTNLWYAAYLGARDEAGGDRVRLKRELDILKASGITNLRILGASERSPLRDAIRPAISYMGQVEHEDLLEGLDFALSEMARRDMKAVVYLNNFWEWSGGMQTYLSWVNDGEFVDMSDPGHPWPAFALATAGFYANGEAVALFNRYLATLVSRRNSVSGTLYRDDPTIMSWQLANEPRPGDGTVSRSNLPHYYAWIAATAKRIKSLAPNQLVSVGSEGTMGCIELEECFLMAHTGNDVDYATFHLWLKNWRWFDATNADATFDSAVARAGHYIDRHVAMAKQLDMPLVLEEFGVERDGGSLSDDSSVRYRDRFFQFVFQRINDSALSGGPLVGSNFWAWGGLGRAAHPDRKWRLGDRSYVGDPPQEAQGLNSVFASDASTLAILSRHAAALDVRH